MNNPHDTIKGLELDWLMLKDQYSEVARALGFGGDSFYGDPLVSHEEVVARAKQLHAQSSGHQEDNFHFRLTRNELESLSDRLAQASFDVRQLIESAQERQT